MLDFSPEKQALSGIASQLICEIQLPRELVTDFECSGLAPTQFDESRRFPRVQCRGWQYFAALGYQHTYPTISRPTAWHRVYTCDICRSGLGFLHSEELFPGEQMQLLLQSSERWTIEIVWCRRLGPQCFHHGARFVKRETANAPKNG